MRRLLFILAMLFTGLSSAHADFNDINSALADKKLNILLIPLLDNNYQITRLDYDSADFINAAQFTGGLGVLPAIAGALIDEENKPDKNKLTNYRPYLSGVDLEKIVIEKIRKDFSKGNSVNISAIYDHDQKTLPVKKLLVKNKLYGNNRKSADAAVYLDLLKNSGFDKVFFVSNENTNYKLGLNKYLPLHGYGIFYDMKRHGMTISYFGATITGYDVITGSNIGEYIFSGKAKARAPKQEAEKLRRARVIKFLEAEYGKTIDKLPQYNFYMLEFDHRKNVKKLFRQFKKDFENSDGNKYKYKFQELRILLSVYAHHQFGDYMNLTDKTRQVLTKQSVTLFTKAKIDITDFIGTYEDENF